MQAPNYLAAGWTPAGISDEGNSCCLGIRSVDGLADQRYAKPSRIRCDRLVDTASLAVAVADSIFADVDATGKEAGVSLVAAACPATDTQQTGQRSNEASSYGFDVFVHRTLQ